MPYKNKEDRNAQTRRWRANNPTRSRELQKRWRENNRDKARTAVALWAEDNKERIKASNAARYQRDKKRIVARNKKYRKDNPEAAIARVHKRRAIKAQSGGSYTAAEWKALCEKWSKCCLCCGRRRKLTADHVIPIAKGGTSDIDNIQPLCMPCNAKKHTGTQDFRITLNLNTTEFPNRLQVYNLDRKLGVAGN